MEYPTRPQLRRFQTTKKYPYSATVKVPHADRAARGLLAMMTKKLQIDICILAEPNRKIAEGAGWERDSRGDATVIICNKLITVQNITRGNSFIAVKTPELTIFSCYVSPDCIFEEYQKYLDDYSAASTFRVEIFWLPVTLMPRLERGKANVPIREDCTLWKQLQI